MNTYQYIAKNNKGQTLNGTLQAASEAEVADILHKKEFIVVAVTLGKATAVKTKVRDKKIKLDELVIFSRQLSTMIDAGIPLVNALNILSEQIENENLRGIVHNVLQDIEAGMSFCDSLAKHPAVFF